MGDHRIRYALFPHSHLLRECPEVVYRALAFNAPLLHVVDKKKYAFVLVPCIPTFLRLPRLEVYHISDDVYMYPFYLFFRVFFCISVHFFYLASTIQIYGF